MASISEPSTCHVFIYFWYLGPATLFWTLTLHVPYTWAWSNYYFQVLVVAGLGMLPILPKHLADRTCKLSLLGTILSSGYSLYSTYGVSTCLSEDWFFFYMVGLWSDVPFCVKKPRAWNMPAIQAWLQSVLATKDFIHLMFSSMLFTSQLHLKSKMHFFSCKFVTLISPFCCFMLLLIILYL